jgi:hypothetical protein
MPKHSASAGARGAAKKNEGSDLFSAILSGVGKIQEQVYLVSKDGEKFFIHEAELEASSDFFKAALRNGMKESGK